jgi:anti-sigma factor RsiW
MNPSGTIQCPAEAELLAYSENRLRGLRRSRLEKHLSGCDDCRETLIDLTQGAFLINVEPLNDPNEQRVRTAGVLQMIQRDERKRQERRSIWSLLPYPSPAAAMAMLLLLVAGFTGVYHLTTRQSPSDTAMESLVQGI